MLDKMVQNILEKTGKSVDEWCQVVNTSGIEKHMAKVKFLKTEHGLTHGYANLIVHAAKGGLDEKSASESNDLVTLQYAKKSDLMPIYELLIKKVKAFGKDVEIAPKKAYVSLRRKKQFGLIQPSTKTRVDVGFCDKSLNPTDRLELSGSFNSMASHRVRITDIKQVDKELIAWLKEAYNNAG